MLPFSVLMSVYQKEAPEHFRRALSSNLECQTLPPTEMVLVCDGPLNPELDAVISEFSAKCPQLKVCRLAENGGLGKALNFGLSQCSHSLVARSDSDDVCTPERFAVQVAYLEQHPDISVVSSAIDEFDEDPERPLRQKLMPEGGEALLRYAKTRNPINHMAVMFRKEDVEKAGSYQHLPYQEDYFLWVRMLSMGMKLANLPQKLVCARVGNGMAARRGEKQLISGRRVLHKYMVDHGLLTKTESFLAQAEFHLWCLVPPKFRDFIYKTILRRQE